MSVPSNAIKEANEQILLMHSRMKEMEKQIEALNLQLVEKERLCRENSKIPIEIQQSMEKKDEEIKQLRTDVRGSKGRIKILEQELLDKDVLLEKFQSKSKIMDEVVGFRGALEGLLSYIKIVEEMERKLPVNDINGNLRETEITEGYKSEDEYIRDSSINGHSQLVQTMRDTPEGPHHV